MTNPEDGRPSLLAYLAVFIGVVALVLALVQAGCHRDVIPAPEPEATDSL